MNQYNATAQILTKHRSTRRGLSFTTPIIPYNGNAQMGSIIPIKRENNSPLTVTMLRKNMNRSLLHTYKKRIGLMQLRKQSIEERSNITFYIPNLHKLGLTKQLPHISTQHNTRPNTSLELANTDVIPIKTKYKYADIRSLLKYSNSFFKKAPLNKMHTNSRALFTNQILAKVSAARKTPIRCKYSEFYKIIIKCKA